MYPNWLNKDCKKAFEDQFVKVSFSQDGEDDFIRSFFWNQLLQGYKGSFIDIGCGDPSLYSNTKLLYLVGWRGMAIDADPDQKILWEQNRPEDLYIERCIVPSNDYDKNRVPFYRFFNRAFSTFNVEQRDFLIKKGIEYRDTVSMNKLSINMIPELCNSAGLTKVDLISIDIEFCNILPDLKCLLDAFRPRLLMLEHISKSLDIHNFSDSEESYYLGKAGYKIVNIIGTNIAAVPWEIDKN